MLSVSFSEKLNGDHVLLILLFVSGLEKLDGDKVLLVLLSVRLLWTIASLASKLIKLVPVRGKGHSFVSVMRDKNRLLNSAMI